MNEAKQTSALEQFLSADELHNKYAHQYREQQEQFKSKCFENLSDNDIETMNKMFLIRDEHFPAKAKFKIQYEYIALCNRILYGRARQLRNTKISETCSQRRGTVMTTNFSKYCIETSLNLRKVSI